MVYDRTQSPLLWSIACVGAVVLGAVASSYWFYGRLLPPQSQPINSRNRTERADGESADGPIAGSVAAPTTDPWQRGRELGWQAAVGAQTATTEADWRQVSNRWRQAIDTLRQVPADAPNATEVQAKIQEYLGNLDAAQQRMGQARRPTPASLNLSRNAIQQVFAAPPLMFDFTAAEVTDGTPRILGRAAEGGTTLALVGPAPALDQIVLTLPLPADGSSLTLADLAAADQLLTTVAPQWDGRTTWLVASLQQLTAAPQSPITTTAANRTLSLSRDGAQVVLTVSPLP